MENSNWWFEARNALISWAIQEKIKTCKTFLEVGCGTGFVLAYLQKKFKGTTFLGSEYHETGLTFARKRVRPENLLQMNLLQMEDVEKYDAIGAFDVLEHVEDDKKAFIGLARALKPDGFLVLTVPQHMWLWSGTDQVACHVRRYEAQDLRDKLKSAGFRVIQCISFVSLLLPLMGLIRRAPIGRNSDPLAELRVHRFVNLFLATVMKIEKFLIRAGIRFPAGGSLLVLAEKT